MSAADESGGALDFEFSEKLARLDKGGAEVAPTPVVPTLEFSDSLSTATTEIPVAPPESSLEFVGDPEPADLPLPPPPPPPPQVGPPPPPSGGSGDGKPPPPAPPDGGQAPNDPHPQGGAGQTGAAPAGARIGDRLVEMGLISKDQLQVALYEKKRTNKLLGTLLVDLGFITEGALSAVLASSSGYEKFDLQGTVVEPDVLKRIPKEVALRYRVLPVGMEGNSLRLAMADIYDVLALDQTRKYAPPGCEIIPLVSSEAEILQAIDQFYGYEFSIDGILRELETGKHDISASALAGEGYVHPLVRLVNAIVLDAVKSGASDIHLEPEGSFVRLRYRIDGVMQQIRTFHKDHWPAISHRIKIVSGMNIADKLNPQDGRFGFCHGQPQDRLPRLLPADSAWRKHRYPNSR